MPSGGHNKKTKEQKIFEGTYNATRDKDKDDINIPPEYAEIIRKQINEISDKLKNIDMIKDFREYTVLSNLRIKLMNQKFPEKQSETDNQSITSKLIKDKKA
jgi:hypothetical protein